MASNMAYTFGRRFVYWYMQKASYVFGRKKGIKDPSFHFFQKNGFPKQSERPLISDVN